MGLIGYKGVLYGGGSDVVANPQDSATDNLEKVSIDGTVYDVTDADAIHSADVGEPNGVAELDENGILLSSQLPSYVDDVLEYASLSAFPATGETGKIYVALDTNLTYRWSGSAYVEITPSLALGETSSTAYRGDRGKTAYDHATESGRSGAKASGLYKIGVTAQGHVASANAVAKADLTALGLADQNDVDAIEEDIEGFKTVTGKYITVTDAAELPAKNYSITISPVQEGSGDPSPSNVRPIHGADEVGVRVCGKNLLVTQPTYASSAISTLNTETATKVIGGKTYTISFGSVSGATSWRMAVDYFDIDGNKITTDSELGSDAFYVNSARFIERSNGTSLSRQITPQKDGFIYVNIAFGDAGASTIINNGQVEFGATATTYEPYNGHSTTITLPSTVYGGSVEQGGSGTVEMAITDFGDLSWGLYLGTFWATVSDMEVGSNGNSGKIASSVYKTVPNRGGFNVEEASICMQIGDNVVMVKNSDYATAAAFKTAMTGQKIRYPLATPTDISVTPFPQTLLEGVNNLWAEMKENSVVIDNAQQSLSYQPQNIIGQLRQEIEAKPDSFAQLSDVSFSGLSNGQIPKWNSTTNKWENANESGGGGTFTRISVQNIVGSTWITTPNNIASLTITAPKEDLGLNNDDFYILEGVELVDWDDSSKKYPYVITKFVDDRENDSISIYGFMIHNESSIRGVNHTFNFIVVS